MKNAHVALVTFLCLGTGLSCGESQRPPTEWELLNQEALDLFAAGEFDSAVVASQKALAVAEKTGGLDNHEVAVSLTNLAGLYGLRGEYAKAEPLYQRSLAIAEKLYGPNHPNVATSLVTLADLYRAMNRLSDAEPLELRATEIRSAR